MTAPATHPCTSKHDSRTLSSGLQDCMTESPTTAAGPSLPRHPQLPLLAPNAQGGHQADTGCTSSPASALPALAWLSLLVAQPSCRRRKRAEASRTTRLSKARPAITMVLPLRRSWWVVQDASTSLAALEKPPCVIRYFGRQLAARRVDAAAAVGRAAVGGAVWDCFLVTPLTTYKCTSGRGRRHAVDSLHKPRLACWACWLS